MNWVFTWTALSKLENTLHCYSSTNDQKIVEVCLMTVGHFACTWLEGGLEWPKFVMTVRVHLTYFSGESEVTLTISAFVVTSGKHHLCSDCIRMLLCIRHLWVILPQGQSCIPWRKDMLPCEVSQVGVFCFVFYGSISLSHSSYSHSASGEAWCFI